MGRKGHYKMCGRKRRFSLRRAHRAAESVNRKQERQVHVYHCPICSAYHTGGVRAEEFSEKNEQN